MFKKYLPLCLLAACALNSVAVAQTKPVATATTETAIKADKTTPTDPMVMANQMMIVFMERMKAGNLKEAMEIADEMIFGHDKFVATEKKEFKTFHSVMEKELYELLQKRAGTSKEVVWVEQPISDGFYFKAILDFQENRHDEALANMAQAIYWNPVRAAFYNERGFMFLKKNSGPDIMMAQIAYLKALELADGNEDFAAGLRGLAFLLVERNRLDQALACLLVSKAYEPDNAGTEEEMMFIKSQAPAMFAEMTFAKANELLKANKIPTGFSADHIQVLLAMANDLTSPKDAQNAILLLKKAQEMAPKNEEVARRLKALLKK